MAVGLELTRERMNYGGHVREDVIAHLHDPGAVLDVGCGEGANADALRARGATRLTGLELDEGFAAQASERYDEVVNASVDDEFPWEPGSFDTILCYDVLEHLYDPWSTVKRLRPLLRESGRIHISLPNARSKEMWAPLVLKGRFQYEPEGIRDVTHIRWFTKTDVTEMLSEAGYEVESVVGSPIDSRKMRLAIALTRGWAEEFLAYQWYVSARARP
ncbi:MAG TPA: class I SAM-dependent methyltransferase [Thermoleophilaceae bacterium]